MYFDSQAMFSALDHWIPYDERERRHLEMMAATLLGSSFKLITNGVDSQWQPMLPPEDAVFYARAIQEEVRKQGQHHG